MAPSGQLLFAVYPKVGDLTLTHTFLDVRHVQEVPGTCVASQPICDLGYRLYISVPHATQGNSRLRWYAFMSCHSLLKKIFFFFTLYPNIRSSSPPSPSPYSSSSSLRRALTQYPTHLTSLPHQNPPNQVSSRLGATSSTEAIQGGPVRAT